MNSLKGIKGNRVLESKFFNENKELAYFTVKKYIKDDFVVDDVIQLGFIKLFRLMDTIDVTKNFNGFIYVTFKNVAIDYLRKKRYDYEYLDNVVLEVEEYDFKEEKLNDIENEMSKLSPMYSLVFKCYHFEDMTHKEISKKLGISEGTSKSNLHKATKNIQKKIKDKIYC
jgi:RNA polymerase sigma-70 factor (ECF subfamily)